MSTNNEQQRQQLIERLVELGMLDHECTYEAWRLLTAVGKYPGALRVAAFDQWSSEVSSLVSDPDLTQWQQVAFALLHKFDLYGLEELVKDSQEVGVNSTYARLLEAAFQFATKIGRHYKQAEALAANSLSGGVSWKQVYVVLTWDNTWNPF